MCRFTSRQPEPPPNSHPYLYVLTLLIQSCGTRRGGGNPPNPGRITLRCRATRDIVESAYVWWADSPLPNSNRMTSGGSSWEDSDLYDIEAIADDDAPQDVWAMQRLLENRFRLKARSETRCASFTVPRQTETSSSTRLERAWLNSAKEHFRTGWTGPLSTEPE